MNRTVIYNLLSLILSIINVICSLLNRDEHIFKRPLFKSKAENKGLFSTKLKKQLLNGIIFSVITLCL
jgi:hypothetical protein